MLGHARGHGGADHVHPGPAPFPPTSICREPARARQHLRRETLLRDALDRWLGEEAAEGRALDFVLFDCPPSLGLLSINGLCAANEVLVVAQTEFFALQGLSKLLGVIELVKQRLNPELDLTGVLAALYDSRLRLAREVLGELRRYFPDETFQTTIGTNVRLAESPSHGQTIFEYAPESRGAQDYAGLAEELIARGNPTAPDGGDLRDKADDLAHADAALRKRERARKTRSRTPRHDRLATAVAPAEPTVESTLTALAPSPPHPLRARAPAWRQAPQPPALRSRPRRVRGVARPPRTRCGRRRGTSRPCDRPRLEVAAVEGPSTTGQEAGTEATTPVLEGPAAHGPETDGAGGSRRKRELKRRRSPGVALRRGGRHRGEAASDVCETEAAPPLAESAPSAALLRLGGLPREERRAGLAAASQA